MKDQEPQSIFAGNVEIRLDRKGRLDEIVLMRGEECVLHLEYLDGNHVWMRVEDVHFDLQAANSIRTFYRIEGPDPKPPQKKDQLRKR